MKIHKAGATHAIMTKDEMDELNLAVKYEVVNNYSVGTTTGSIPTPQEKFIKLDGSTVSAAVYDAATAYASQGRTPIIRAILYRTNEEGKEDIVEVGYIKIQWKGEAVNPEDKYLTLNDFTFKCAGQEVVATVEQINKDLYEASKMSMEQFHKAYPDLKANNNGVDGTYFKTGNATADAKYVDDVIMKNIGTVEEVTNIVEGAETYSLKWKVTAEEMFKAGNKEITHTVVYTNGTNTNPMTIVLRATVKGVEKESNIALADFIAQYWDAQKTYAKFNVAVPQNTSDADATHCIFMNDLNSPFTTVEGRLKISKVADVTVNNITYKFNAAEMAKITAVGGHKVKYEVKDNAFGKQTALWASVDDNASVQIAQIYNEKEASLADVPYNYVELQNVDNAKVLLNDQTADAPFKAFYMAVGNICDNFEVSIKFNGNDYFRADWITPVKIIEKAAKYLVDAVDFEEYRSFIKLEELVDPSDWRDRAFSAHTNYWKYYGVTDIQVDLSDVRTDLNGVDWTKKETGALPATLSVGVYDKDGNRGTTVGKDYIGPNTIPTSAKFKKADKSAESAKYGFLAYKNNGTTTQTEFNMYFKAVFKYKWGELKSGWIKVNVRPTEEAAPKH